MLRRHFMFRASAFFFAILLGVSLITQTALAYDVQFFKKNDIFLYDPEACKVNAGGDVELRGTSAEMIWSYLVSKGLTPEQAAGIMGNIRQESGYVPTRHQSDTNDIFNSQSGRAWGLIQWDGGRRFTAPDGGILGALREQKSNLVKYADISFDTVRNPQAQIPEQDFAELMLFQLDYMYQESNGRTAKASYGGGNEWEGLKRQKTIEEALVYWHDNAERSADTPQEVITRRGAFAQEAYNNFKTLSPARPADGGPSSKPTVFLDPGHGAAIPQYIDEVTGLADRETDNGQETKDMLEVANRIKAELEKDGYTVVLARTKNDEAVTKRERVDKAKGSGAQIAVSLHSDTSLNQVWAQKVGTSRTYNGKTVTFSNETVANKSRQFTDIMAAERKKVEGNDVTTDPNNIQQAQSFGREGVPSKGNISLVQLWGSDIPWVYNEISRDVNGTGLSNERKNAYTKGVAEAIRKSVPLNTATSGCTGSNFDGGDFDETLLAYAWNTYKGSTVVARGEWEAAVKNAKAAGKYVGGTLYAGIDCGGFVTNLLLDSGFEPAYNYSGITAQGAGNTVTQRTWLEQNWELVGTGSSIDVGELQKGDVAIQEGHTFIYVGEVLDFESNIASASWDTRAPMAGKESLTKATTGELFWYRKKGNTPSNSDGGTDVRL
jgi:N-acetylmuramoyl-L-alanine amidase